MFQDLSCILYIKMNILRKCKCLYMHINLKHRAWVKWEFQLFEFKKYGPKASTLTCLVRKLCMSAKEALHIK